MLKHLPNTNTKGDAAVGIAISYYTYNNYTVCIPLTDSQAFDLVVVDSNADVRKIQIKYTSAIEKDGVHYVDLRTRNMYYSKNLDKSLFDDLFIVTSKGFIYIIPATCISGTVKLRLGEKYKEFLVKPISVNG